MNRRYDIDWLRVIAIGLLLIYHIAVTFQPWGVMIAFPTNAEPWPSVWIPMTMLNIWRIPLLFFVSGMGVYFSLQGRNWKQLLMERARRIGVPYLFGFFVLVPVHILLWQKFNGFSFTYTPNPGHLWFLGNIFMYVLILSPLFYYLKKHEDGKLVKIIRRLFSHPVGLALIHFTFLVEAWTIKPFPYELYAMTWHGFFLGLLAFFYGYCLVLTGDGFRSMVTKARWILLAGAVTLFAVRTGYWQMNVPMGLLTLESVGWIFALFGFANKYLNRESKTLQYLSGAAYPVYILHMIFICLGAMVIFPLQLSVEVKLLFMVLFVTGGCLLMYEFVVRRWKVLRLLMGGRE